MNKNYFELADRMYDLCIPLIFECAKGNLTIREFCKSMSPQLEKIIGWNISTELEPFVGEYLNFYCSANRHETMINASSFAPYWMYVSDSPFCLHRHGSLNGLVFRFDDPFWNRYYVPNSWGCCCHIRNFTEIELNQKQHRFLKKGERLPEIKPPYDINPGKKDWLPVYKKTFIQHFATLLYENENYEWNEEDEY